MLELLVPGAVLTRAKLRDMLGAKNERLGAALEDQTEWPRGAWFPAHPPCAPRPAVCSAASVAVLSLRDKLEAAS